MPIENIDNTKIYGEVALNKNTVNINNQIDIKQLSNVVSQDTAAKTAFLKWIIKQQNNIHENKKTTYYKQTIKTLIRLVLNNENMYKCLKRNIKFKTLR